MGEKWSQLKRFIVVVINSAKILWETSHLMLIATMLINLIVGAIVPISLLIWKNLLDNITQILTDESLPKNTILVWLSLYLCLKLVMLILVSLNSYLQGIYASCLNKYIIDKSLSKIIELDLIEFDNADIYDTIQKASSESTSRCMNILSTLVSLIKNITTTMGVIVILISFNIVVSILCLVSVIPTFFVNLKISFKWFEIFNKRFQKLRFAKCLEEICIKNENIKEIKLFGLGVFFKDRILHIYDTNIREDKKLRAKFSMETLGIDVVGQLIVYITKIYVIAIIIVQKMTIGTLVMYVDAIDNLNVGLSNVLNLLSSTYEDSLYMENIFKLLEINSREKVRKRIFDGKFRKIEFKKVYFKYEGSKEYVFKDLNLIIESGHSYSIVGLNGAGKTTLIKLLIGLYNPVSGSILIDDIDQREYEKKSIWENISAVFQDYIKYPLSIAENIGVGNISKMGDKKLIMSCAEIASASQFIEKLPYQYETQLQKEWEKGVDLSLGQWQKLAVSRALMRDATILILDEPTASLDILAEQKIFKNYRQMIKGKTSILIAHRFSTIRLSEYIIVLKEGKIIEEGTHEQLVRSKGEYAHMYEVQSELSKLG